MKPTVQQILVNKGYAEICYSIVKSIYDLKKAGYDRSEVKETLMDIYSDGGKLDKYIETQLSLIF